MKTTIVFNVIEGQQENIKYFFYLPNNFLLEIDEINKRKLKQTSKTF